MGRPAKPTPEKPCVACGKKLERKRFPSGLEDMAQFAARKYCDQKCMANAYIKEICKSESHTRAKAHRTVKTSCESCGKTGRLHVHHIDGNPYNNRSENLKTLCGSCHRLTHSPNYMGTPERRKSCSLCSRPVARRGYCNTHLTRFKKYGDPLMTKVKIGSEWHLRKVAL